MSGSVLSVVGFLWAATTLWLFGATLRRSFGGTGAWRSAVATDTVIGMAVVASLGTIQLLIGVPLTPLPFYGLLTITSIVAWRRREHRSVQGPDRLVGSDPLVVGLLVIALVGVVVMFHTARRDVLWWDGWAIWAFKAKVLQLTGTLPATFLSAPGPYAYTHPTYPIGVPVVTWWFLSHAVGAATNVPSLVGALQFAILIGLVWEILRARIAMRMAALTTAVVAWIDPVASHAVGGTAEVVMAIALVGVIDLLRSQGSDASSADGLRRWRGGAALLLAALSKQEGAALLVVVTLVVASTWRSHRRQTGRWWSAVLAAALFMWGLWQLRVGRVAVREPLIAFDLSFASMASRLADLLAVAQAVIWEGWWWPSLLLALLALIHLRHVPSLPQLPAWGAIAGYLGAIICVYLVTPLDHHWLLRTSFVRVTSAILPALLVLSMIDLSGERSAPPAGGLVARWRRWQIPRLPALVLLGALTMLSARAPLRAQAQAPPTRLLLLPLDDRPSSIDFPVRLGAIAGVTVVTPPRALLGRFTVPADVDAVARWVRRTLALAPHRSARPPADPPVDAVIVSIDLLAYGGLVASRTLSSASAETALARLWLLRDLRARYPRLPIYASASLMRLAPTADGRNEPYREALARWAELAPDSARPAEAEELGRLRARIPATALAAYRATRARNVRVHEALLGLSADRVLTHLVFTQDDARARGVHLEERARLRAQVTQRGLEDRISLQSGTDEFGMLLVARALTDRRGTAPSVAVHYVMPGDSARLMPFEDRPLAETVRAHLRLTGATITAAEEGAALRLVVHTDRANGAPSAATLIRESRRPVILADIDPTGSIQGADTTLTDLLTAEGRFATLAGYGGWNTAGNAIGTAVAHGVVRWLAEPEASSASPVHRPGAQASFLLDRWLDDDLYKSRIRPGVVASVRARGWDPFRLTRGQTEVVEGEIGAAVQRRVAQRPDLTSVIGAGCRLTSPIEVRLPWGRTFEAAFDFTVRCD